MAERLSLDTTLLIDLQRERRGANQDGAAHTFLRAHAEAQLCLSIVALGEFAEGFTDPDEPLLQVVRNSHVLLSLDTEVAFAYARCTRRLRSDGRLIGTNDLWIAATALRYGLPLVTANVEHFSRVAGLRVIAYRSEK